MMGPLKQRKVLNSKGEVEEQVALKVLDVAGGTGDISFRILDKARADSPGSINSFIIFLGLAVNITVSDINADMLEVGKKRAVERGYFHGKIIYL